MVAPFPSAVAPATPMSDQILYDQKWPFLTPALVFGAAFDLLFFGILTAQVYIYYASFPKDRPLFKLAVAWVYLVGVVQTGLALLDVRITWMTGLQALHNPGNIPILSPDHLWLSITVSTAAVVIVIHSLYAHRIYVISKKRWLASIIICMSVVQLASGILGAVCYSQERAVYTQTIFEVLGGNLVGEDVCHFGFIWIWGPINAVCDVTIAVCMVTFVSLLRHRRRTVRLKTRSHITGIVQIVVETGMATAILMIIYTFLFAFESAIPLYVGPLFPLPGLIMSKVYSNSMLVLLNNRASIVSRGNVVESSFELTFVDVSVRGLDGDIQMRTRGQNSTTSS